MNNSATLDADDLELPWGGDRGSEPKEIFHLVIAWSLDEPLRVGQVAPIPAPRVLGRGGPQPGDPAGRLVFCQQRPTLTQHTPPLASARLSRQQLHLVPKGEQLEVAQLGRCPLLVGGEEVKEAQLGPGDVLVLKNTLVLLVVRRPRTMAPLRAFTAQDTPFGAPDAFGMVGESAALWALRDSLASVARSRHHVLLRGDSGAGKELAARAIHALSERAGRPLVSRNAATLPEGLLDAELFGNARNYPHAGAPERPGLFGEADGGTLFLDEIGEMPERLQAHLLRVLDQGGEYQRLGESRVRRSDVRLLCATNRPLESLKHDFAARLTGRVALPGLDERCEDVPLLVQHFLRGAAAADPALAGRLFSRQGETLVPHLEPALMERLLRHRYTHHMRELERLLFSALMHSPGKSITLPPELRATAPEEEAAAEGAPAVDPATLDREAIEAALRACGGSTTQAARQLGLRSRFALYRLMKRFGISAQTE